MRYRLPLIAVLMPMILLLAGCTEEKPRPVSSPPKKVKVSPPNPVETSALAEEVLEPEPPVYRYDPDGRDPFESLLTIKKPVAPEGMLTPLQKFDIGQLRLIGVIIGKGDPRAMVVAPDGKSYILKKGVKVGKNDGTVIELNQDVVRVQERYVDFSGEIRTVIQEIMLPKREGV